MRLQLEMFEHEVLQHCRSSDDIPFVEIASMLYRAFLYPFDHDTIGFLSNYSPNLYAMDDQNNRFIL